MGVGVLSVLGEFCYGRVKEFHPLFGYVRFTVGIVTLDADAFIFWCRNHILIV